MQAAVSCVIADNEELDRLATLSFVRKYPFLKVDGVFAGAEALLDAMHKITPDVLFLDIDMPDISGLQLREKLMHIPVCIFITSFPEYAVESFEKDALDFLVKPIRIERFEKTMERLRDYLDLREKAALLDTTLGGEAIFIKEGHERVKVQLRNILYLEALKDYTRIVTPEKKYCVLSALGNLLKEEPFQSFIRVHRSYAIQKEYISRITSSHIWVQNYELPIGRSYKDLLAGLSNS